MKTDPKHSSLDFQMRTLYFFSTLVISHQEVAKHSWAKLSEWLQTISVYMKYIHIYIWNILEKFLLTLKPDTHTEGSMDISCLIILPWATCSLFIYAINLSCNFSSNHVFVVICQDEWFFCLFVCLASQTTYK